LKAERIEFISYAYELLGMVQL